MSVPVSKREVGDVMNGVYSLIGFNFREFVTENPQDQLDRLLQSCKSFAPGSQYLFSMLNDHQRSEILSVSNEFQRFQLFRNYDLRNKGLLLAGMSQIAEVESILELQDSAMISKMLELSDDDHRSMIISKMNPRLQAKWIFYLADKKFITELNFFTESQKERLAEEFTVIRVTKGYEYLDYEFITKHQNFGKFLDQLAEYFTRKQALMVLSTSDPIIFISRFTPKERESLFNFINIGEKRQLLDALEKHQFQKFPKGFFDSDIIRNNYFAGSKEWKELWEDVRFEVAEHDRLQKLRKVFRHSRSKSVDSIPQSFADNYKSLLTFSKDAIKKSASNHGFENTAFKKLTL